MKQYLDLLQHILDNGVQKSDRTGTGTISTFGYQMRFNLNDGFPLVTTKRVPFRLIASELLWFIKGDTNIQYLLKHNNHIWDEWCYEDYKNMFLRIFPDETPISISEFADKVRDDDAFASRWGDLGDVYGKQWRRWQGVDKFRYAHEVDQLTNVINSIKNNPDSRRHMVVAYNPAEVENMALPPCHSMFQFYVVNGKLSCQMYQRSADVFLGVPFNIASYALLTQMIAQVTGLELGEFIHTFGDVHIYLNHIDQVRLQLTREPRPLPRVRLNPDIKSIYDFTMDDIILEGYNAHPSIKGEVSV